MVLASEQGEKADAPSSFFFWKKKKLIAPIERRGQTITVVGEESDDAVGVSCSPTERMSIGVIGCGNLGSQFVARALKAGLGVVAFDLDASRVPRGATVAASICDVVERLGGEERGTILSIVPNDLALRSVATELMKTSFPFDHVSCSTASPDASRDLAREHAHLGLGFAAAPVFGRPENIRDDQASFVVSGPARDQAAKVLGSFAAPRDRVFDFGEDPGAANVVKLCGNFMIGASIQVMAEGLALAEANGADRQRVMDILSSTIFDCPIFKGYGHRVSRRDHRPGGFSLQHGLKDIDLVTQHLATHSPEHMKLPFLRALHQQFLDAHTAGLTDLDWSAVALATSPLATKET